MSRGRLTNGGDQLLGDLMSISGLSTEEDQFIKSLKSGQFMEDLNKKEGDDAAGESGNGYQLRKK